MDNNKNIKFEKLAFEENDQNALKFFVKNGYVHYKNLFPKDLINRSSEFVLSSFLKLKKISDEGEFPTDFQGWGNAVLEKFATTNDYKLIIENSKSINILKKIFRE